MAHEALIKEGEQALKKGIKPPEVEEYFVKKGMDEKEAEKAIKDTTKKQHIPYQSKKSSFWVVLFVIIILLVIAVFLLNYLGIKNTLF